MTRELAMVHAREGIRLNSLCPYVLWSLHRIILMLIYLSSGPLKTRQFASLMPNDSSC